MTHIGEIAVPRTDPHGQNTTTLPELLAHQASARGDTVALLHKRLGIWQTWTWQQAADTAARWAAGLARLGVASGDSVVIAGTNRPCLLLALLACQLRGAVPVLVPQAGAGAGLAQVLRAQVLRAQSAGVVFVAGEHEVHAIRAIRDTLARPPQVICDDLRGLRSLWAEWLTDWDAFDAAADAQFRPDTASAIATAAIVYAPADVDARKPIALTHHALVRAAVAATDAHGLTAADRAVLAVPLGWPSALLLGPAQALVSGASLAFPESDATVLEDLHAVGPTLLFGPPLLFRQIRQAGYRHAASAGMPWRAWLDRALGFTIHETRAPGVLTRVLLAALRRRLGLSRLRHAISTEAAVVPRVAAFFNRLGIATYVLADPVAAPVVPSPLSGSVFIRAGYVTSASDGAAVALIAPDVDAIALWAQQRGEAVRSTEDIAGLASVTTLLAAEIRAIDPDILRFAIAAHGLTPQGGDLAADGQPIAEVVERFHAVALRRLRDGYGHPVTPLSRGTMDADAAPIDV